MGSRDRRHRRGVRVRQPAGGWVWPAGGRQPEQSPVASQGPPIRRGSGRPRSASRSIEASRDDCGRAQHHGRANGGLLDIYVDVEFEWQARQQHYQSRGTPDWNKPDPAAQVARKVLGSWRRGRVPGSKEGRAEASAGARRFHFFARPGSAGSRGSQRLDCSAQACIQGSETPCNSLFPVLQPWYGTLWVLSTKRERADACAPALSAQFADLVFSYFVPGR